MYEFWYDYMKKKYGDMVKLCCMDTESLIMNIKKKDFCKDIAQDVERFDTSNYDVDRPLPKGKNKKVISLMKDELAGGIITDMVGSLFDNEPMLKSQQRFKSEHHEVYTENINKIALSSNDDKRIVALDEITSYPYGYCGED